MKKVIVISILIVFISFGINKLFTNYEYASEYVANDGSIYDVILFWGQSNMVGCAHANKEDRYDPTNDADITNYSKDTGIDKSLLASNGANRNQITINQEAGTVYEYMYKTNSLNEINSNTKYLGERLYYKYDSKGNLTTLGQEENSSKLAAINSSNGINMIPEFGKVWYQRTGHKVVVVFCAWPGIGIEKFLPSTDPSYPTTEKRYTYEAIKTKWNAAIKYLNSNGYKIGNKLYVVFQGEANINNTKDKYKSNFKKVHNNMKKDLGITAGAIVETSTTIGSEKLTEINNMHTAQEELIKENSDIVLGSSYSYDRFVPAESQYGSCKTKVCYDSKGNKLEYSEAFSKASKSVDYDTNTIHFTSAALSQIGKESAESFSKINSIKLSTLPSKTEYIQNYENLDVTGGKITVDFANIKDDLVSLKPTMVTGFDNSKIGSQSLKVNYLGANTKYDVVVKGKEASSIELNEKPTKTKYIQNYENLDVTGGKLLVKYNDESTETVDLTNDMVSGFDNSKVGKNVLTITYGNFTTNLEVEIVEKAVDEIKVYSKPDKIEYSQGDKKIDVTGGKLEIIYNDGTTEIIDITPDMVTGFDSSKPGIIEITVGYNGKVDKYSVKINSVAKEDDKNNTANNNTTNTNTTNNNTHNENTNTTNNNTHNENTNTTNNNTHNENANTINNNTHNENANTTNKNRNTNISNNNAQEEKQNNVQYNEIDSKLADQKNILMQE